MWYAMVSYKDLPMQPPMMAVFIAATTEDPPKIPPGYKILGRVRHSRTMAIQEAMTFLQAEMIANREI